jgi:hypothetical protein
MLPGFVELLDAGKERKIFLARDECGGSELATAQVNGRASPPDCDEVTGRIRVYGVDVNVPVVEVLRPGHGFIPAQRHKEHSSFLGRGGR